MVKIIIYKITNNLNGKLYIGQTNESLKKRFSRHMGYQKDKADTKFYRAVRKYGVENFTIEQIDEAITQEELDIKEVYWINILDTYNNGYNSKKSKGKCGGDTLSNHDNLEEIKNKLRISKIGDKNPMRKYGGLKGDKNGMFGKNGNKNPAARKCVAISKESGEIINFDTLLDMKDHFNVTTLGMVSSRCSGRTKSDYKGYYFKYYEDYMESQSTIESIV